MIFALIKKKIFSSYAKIFYITVIIFLLLDIIFSNTIIKNVIKKDCLEFIEYLLNGKKYYTYDLEKNCKAFETKRTVKTYKVFTDENGYRISGKKREKKKDNSVIFLGDSFTYGLGLNYEKTIVGFLENKNINYQLINLAVPGYSPLILKFKLRKILESGIKPKKIFYLMDLTDVHDESNRWIEIDEFKYPVILDNKIQKEIKKIFTFGNNFKMTRLLIYNLNALFRNARKSFNQANFEKLDKNIGKTQWGNFTHTPYEKLDKNFWINNDFKIGIKNIKKNVKSISEMAREINSEFYIVIYPWAETLEYGEKYFSWQKFSTRLCQFSGCTKVVNAFPEFKKIKKNYTFWKKEIYILDDLHLNENGNQMLAEIIYKEAFK